MSANVTGANGESKAKVYFDPEFVKEKTKKVIDPFVDGVTAATADTLKETVDLLTQPTSIKFAAKGVKIGMGCTSPSLIPCTDSMVDNSEKHIVKGCNQDTKNASNQSVDESTKGIGEIAKGALNKAVGSSVNSIAQLIQKC
jgi:hypothetical protein